MQIPDNSLVAGVPARVIRGLKPEEIEWKRDGTRCYHELVERCHASLEAVDALIEKDNNRPSLNASMIDKKA